MPQVCFPERDDRQFQCFKKDEGGLDCTFVDQDALEVGRHLGRDHGVPAADIKWGKIWNKVGIVSKVDGTDLRKKWGRRGSSAVKYEQGVFQPAPSTDSEDSWLYKLCDVERKKNKWVQVKKSTVEGWKRLAVMSQAEIDRAAR